MIELSPQAEKTLRTEMELFITLRLFQQGTISEELYREATAAILKNGR